jgi:hypothetical protein
MGLVGLCTTARSSTVKGELARLLRDTKAGILLNEHIAEDGPTVFAHARWLGAAGIVSKRADGIYRSGPYRGCVRNPASLAVHNGSAARSGTGNIGPAPQL